MTSPENFDRFLSRSRRLGPEEATIGLKSEEWIPFVPLTMKELQGQSLFDEYPQGRSLLRDFTYDLLHVLIGGTIQNKSWFEIKKGRDFH